MLNFSYLVFFKQIGKTCISSLLAIVFLITMLWKLA